MKKFNLPVVYFIIILGGGLFLTSCLGSGTNRQNSQLAIFLQLKGSTTQAGNADTTLVAGNDSLKIKNLRLIQGKSQLNRDTLEALKLSPRMLKFSSSPNPNPTGNTQSGDANLLGSGRQGIAGNYQSFDLKIIQANNSLTDSVDVDDIFTDNGHYSIIIKGTYNHKDFTFKSKKNIDRTLQLETPVEVPKNNANVYFFVQANVKDWFMKNSGGFYDPSDTTNTSDINANIERSFHIETKGTGNGTGTGGYGGY